MNTNSPRIATSFRLRSDLMERLRISAAKANRSLNNYVESLLIDIEFNKPNAETRSAMAEALDGKSAGTLDVSSFESFMRDVNALD